MANALYEGGRDKFLRGAIAYVADNIKAALLASTYPGGLTALQTHEFYSDIAAHVIPGTSVAKTLTSKTTTVVTGAGTIKGVAGADGPLFTAVTTGYTVGFLILFKDTASTVDGAPATPATAPLIALIDSGFGIGTNTNGADIQITWDATNKIFKL